MSALSTCWQKYCAKERYISMVARVTINAGISISPTMTPFTSPQVAPNPTANRKVSKILSVILKIITEKPPSRASIAPTDKSISPVRHTSPMPSPMIPITAECRNTFITPLQVSPLDVKAYTAKIATNTSM